MSAPGFSAKQGQYLAFIYAYTKLNRVAPAEADMQRYFEVSAPTVHATIIRLETVGLITRVPRQARSIRLCIAAGDLPVLE